MGDCSRGGVFKGGSKLLEAFSADNLSNTKCLNKVLKLIHNFGFKCARHKVQ